MEMYYFLVRLILLIVLIIIYTILFKVKLKTKKLRIRVAIILFLLYNILYSIPLEKNLLKFDNYMDSFNYYNMYKKIDKVIEYGDCVMIIYTQSNGNHSFAAIGKNNGYWNSVETKIVATHTFNTVIVSRYEKQNKMFIGVDKVYFDNNEYKELYISDSLNSEFTKAEFEIYSGKDMMYYIFIDLNKKTDDYNIKIDGEQIFIKAEEDKINEMNIITVISLLTIIILIIVYLLNLINRKKRLESNYENRLYK